MAARSLCDGVQYRHRLRRRLADESVSDAATVASPAPGGQASVVLTEDFGGRQLFPSDNGWNQDITNAPIDPQSGAFIFLHRRDADRAS